MRTDPVARCSHFLYLILFTSFPIFFLSFCSLYSMRDFIMTSHFARKISMSRCACNMPMTRFFLFFFLSYQQKLESDLSSVMNSIHVFRETIKLRFYCCHHEIYEYGCTITMMWNSRTYFSCLRNFSFSFIFVRSCFPLFVLHMFRSILSTHRICCYPFQLLWKFCDNPTKTNFDGRFEMNMLYFVCKNSYGICRAHSRLTFLWILYRTTVAKRKNNNDKYKITHVSHTSDQNKFCVTLSLSLSFSHSLIMLTSLLGIPLLIVVGIKNALNVIHFSTL